MRKVQSLGAFEKQFLEIIGNALDKRERATVTTPATPDTEYEVMHGLGVIPSGFIVIDKDKAADTYRSGTAWTDEKIYLKTNVATATLTILVF